MHAPGTMRTLSPMQRRRLSMLILAWNLGVVHNGRCSSQHIWGAPHLMLILAWKRRTTSTVVSTQSTATLYVPRFMLSNTSMMVSNKWQPWGRWKSTLKSALWTRATGNVYQVCSASHAHARDGACNPASMVAAPTSSGIKFRLGFGLMV